MGRTLEDGMASMFKVSSKAKPLQQAAVGLRKAATPAEQVVWELVRGRRLQGLKFRRQHVLEGHIVDFFCHEKQLCIELDGAPHLEPAQKSKDIQRDLLLGMRGFTVLRFMNEEVLRDPAGFRQKLLSAPALTNTFPPLQGREAGAAHRAFPTRPGEAGRAE
jgi:very-short-patch-repair endonuclease